MVSNDNDRDDDNPSVETTDIPGALLLAAGEGTRLGSLTERCPKPLLPIGGRPALLWILDWLRAAEVPAVTINVHYRPEAFYDTLRNRYHGIPIEYRYEPTLLGSAGTLRAHLMTVSHRCVLVAYADVLTTLSIARLLAFHQSRPIHPCATLAVHAVPDPQTGGVVRFEADRITQFEEKPANPASAFVFSGVAVVDAGIRDLLPDSVPSDLGHDVFPALCRGAFPLYALPLEPEEYLVDFGTPGRYAQACREWPKRRI